MDARWTFVWLVAGFLLAGCSSNSGPAVDQITGANQVVLEVPGMH